jgi:hypothetical protein
VIIGAVRAAGGLASTQALTGYRRFYDEVVTAQVTAWLPERPARILDLSGGGGRFAALVAAEGHRVLHVLDGGPACRGDLPAMWRVRGETQDLGWLRDGTVDGVLAEGGALSAHLAAEHTFGEVARVLRPGGRMLLCVDSLMLGLARLAEQSRWAELADVPSADVVLVPNEDGSITRCFWPEELEQVLREDGFEVEWVRPRTVLPRETVERALAADPGGLRTLVTTELALAAEREGESAGIHLLASARRA